MSGFSEILAGMASITDPYPYGFNYSCFSLTCCLICFIVLILYTSILVSKFFKFLLPIQGTRDCCRHVCLLHGKFVEMSRKLAEIIQEYL